MRFRSSIDNFSQILKLTKILTYLSKSITNAVIKLQKDQIIISDRFSDGEINGLQMNCILPISNFFTEYTLKPQNINYPEICFILESLPTFVKILQNATKKYAKRMRIKLSTQGDKPCLVIESTISNLSSGNSFLRNAIFITIITKSKWFLYSSRFNFPFDVKFKLSSVRKLKTLLSSQRYKVSNIKIGMDRKRRLFISLRGISSKIDAFITNGVKDIDFSSDLKNNQDVCLTVKLKQLLIFLDLAMTKLNTLTIGISSDKTIVFESSTNLFTLEYALKGVIE
ncbi:MAG: DNA damage checkpoint control protein [Marteilia pararefringens]